jgi:hypothetical protein
MDPAAYLAALQNWMALGNIVVTGGKALWDDLQGVFAKHGIEQDNAALDAVILNAATRKAQADREAAGPADGA